MKQKLSLIVLMCCINSICFSQVADYYTTGYHVKKYDAFLEDFTKENEPCYKSNTFKISITTTKMRIEIEDSSNNSGNTSMDSYLKDIILGEDLPVDSGALFHKSFSGTMKKLIIDDAYINTRIPKYQTLKFTGRMYGHKFIFSDLVADKAESGDVFLCFIYENGEKDNMRIHLAQKSPSQVESENLKNKMHADMAEIQKQRDNQLKIQEQIKQEEERLLKAKKAEQNTQLINGFMNDLQTIFKKN
jgi:hypothetical protein